MRKSKAQKLHSNKDTRLLGSVDKPTVFEYRMVGEESTALESLLWQLFEQVSSGNESQLNVK